MAISNAERQSLLEDKLRKTVNFLDFTGLTYEEIITQINAKVSSNSDLDNFRESAIAQTLLEIFAGSTDLINYYLERRAEECFLDTAQLPSSVILLAKALGYIVKRPIPASTSIKMKIKGPMTAGVIVGDIIQVPAQTKFTYDGESYLLKDTFAYTLSAMSDGTLPSDANYEFEVDLTPKLIQGEIMHKAIIGSTNQQSNQKFQIYKIDDKTFSNLYGEEDIGAAGNYFDGPTYVPSDLNTTKILVGNDINATNYFQIDRRSLLNWTTLNSFTNTSASTNTCLIRTRPDETVELVFGDDQFASIGAATGKVNIYIQYLSTKGSKVNKVGVIGDKIICDASILTPGSKDVTSNLKFEFITNILGGADLEDIDSIRYNAPSVFYSLDRCVTAQDYITFLKTLTSPIIVKNAIAWGEQDEINQQTQEDIGLYKFINVVLFSVLGSLYNLDSEPHGINSMENTTLEGVDYGTSGSYNSYYQIITKTDPYTRIKDLDTSQLSSGIIDVYDKLKVRSQITVKNIYISPIIHDYDISGTVYLRKLSDQTIVDNKIKNAVYEFLDKNADFAENVYLSNIVDIIESFKEVVYTDMSIESVSPTGTEWQSWVNYLPLDDLGPVFTFAILCLLSYFPIYYPGVSPLNIETTSLTAISVITSNGTNFSNRYFYNVFMPVIYGYWNGVNPTWANSGGFINFVSAFYRNFEQRIKRELINSEGNITFDNPSYYFALKNEIARLRVNLTYQYK